MTTKTKINTRNAADYVNRFLDGSTTPAEEKALYAFFAHAHRLPEELEQYRMMFAWYAAGMPDTPEEFATGYRSHTLRLRHTEWRLWGSSAAAAVALLVAGGYLFTHRHSAIPDGCEAYRGSYVMVDGQRINASAEEMIQLYRQAETEINSVEIQMQMEEIERHELMIETLCNE